MKLCEGLSSNQENGFWIVRRIKPILKVSQILGFLILTDRKTNVGVWFGSHGNQNSKALTTNDDEDEDEGEGEEYFAFIYRCLFLDIRVGLVRFCDRSYPRVEIQL